MQGRRCGWAGNGAGLWVEHGEWRGAGVGSGGRCGPGRGRDYNSSRLGTRTSSRQMGGSRGWTAACMLEKGRQARVTARFELAGCMGAAGSRQQTGRAGACTRFRDGERARCNEVDVAARACASWRSRRLRDRQGAMLWQCRGRIEPTATGGVHGTCVAVAGLDPERRACRGEEHDAAPCASASRAAIGSR